MYTIQLICCYRRDEFWHYLGAANDEGVAEVTDDTWSVPGRGADDAE